MLIYDSASLEIAVHVVYISLIVASDHFSWAWQMEKESQKKFCELCGILDIIGEGFYNIFREDVTTVTVLAIVSSVVCWA